MIPDHFLRHSFSLSWFPATFPPPPSTSCHHHYPRNNKTVSQCETITRWMLCMHELWNSEFICKHAPLISAGTLQNWWNYTSGGCCVDCVIAKKKKKNPQKCVNHWSLKSLRNVIKMQYACIKHPAAMMRCLQKGIWSHSAAQHSQTWNSCSVS